MYFAIFGLEKCISLKVENQVPVYTGARFLLFVFSEKIECVFEFSILYDTLGRPGKQK